MAGASNKRAAARGSFPRSADYLRRILTAKVYDVARETPLDTA